ncbi:AAA domain-containing protein [Achromobacter sp.]|uniref:DEAD/DEAH box helicase n=1 Tax=Achromobacter sp. TaxID=134375 RepID=UPI0028A92681|nr:AAA domain-containing protein [Achromobacter sp.]
MQTDTIFRFWRAIEACIPQKIERTDACHPARPSYKIPQVVAQLPWAYPRHLTKRIDRDKMWRYTLECGLYDISKLCQQIEERIGAHEDVFGESRPAGEGRLFDLSFDEDGYPLAQSFTLSLACWSAGQILHYRDGIAVLESGGLTDPSTLPPPEEGTPVPQTGFHAFDVLSGRLTQWLMNEASRLRQEETPPGQSWFDALTLWVANYCLLPQDLIQPTYVARCSQIKRPKKDENPNTPDNAAAQPDGLLNSFFVGDLKTLSDAWEQGRYGPGLREYIGNAARDQSARVDVRSETGVQAAFDALRPACMPQGSWPSEFPLAFSQQLAVNELWRKLGNASGIFAVNGPPGTGKTTLLRDVVAAVVTARAASLVAAGETAFGVKQTTKLGNTSLSHYTLHPSLCGHAIVVASANNGAVENISLELPGINAVPQSVADTLSTPTQAYPDYYARLATSVLGKSAWGLLAARMGSKNNRSQFMTRFWWKKPDPTKDAPRSNADELPFSYDDEGLRYHLERIRDQRRMPVLSWESAVAGFRSAQTKENRLRQALIDASSLRANADDLKALAAQLSDTASRGTEALEPIRRELENIEQAQTGKKQELGELSGHLDAASRNLERHDAAKPGFLIWLSTLGRAHRQWWNQRLILADIHAKAETTHTRANGDLRSLTAKHKAADARISKAESEVAQARSAHAQAVSDADQAQRRLEQAQQALGTAWPMYHADDAVRELSSPWSTTDWRQARQELFLAALAVHRAFIERHPTQMLANLGLASDWLAGKHMPEAMAQQALDSLCLVVPVLSTTFASMPRMFKQVSSEAIGWLLIDEAGQALPQQAAGAIWRARRIVVVGDPNQLEPVLALPVGLEGALAKHFGVNKTWWPSDSSAQRLADQTMSMGTWLPDEAMEKIWVGSPLRVHRRCDDPMFSISNQIAYDGLMVQGKAVKQKPYPACHWIDVRSDTSEGNWIPNEGSAATELVRQLTEQEGVPAGDIFLISPFKDCARKLSELATKFGLDSKKTGTIHTTQGKEADVVILVLGGNPQRHGAKDWAAQKPNLLNVAVSRAKSRLYVVGDRQAWSQRRHFSVLAEKIPGVSSALATHDVGVSPPPARFRFSFRNASE